MGKPNNYSYLDLINSPILSSKAIDVTKDNRYTFLVHPKSTKPKIKEAIEFLFDVQVLKINTCHLPPIRYTNKFGFRRHHKKAVIKLVKEDSLNFYSPNLFSKKGENLSFNQDSLNEKQEIVNEEKKEQN